MRSLPSPAAIVTRRFTTACQALPATIRLRRRHIQLWYSRAVNPTNLANWCRPRALPALAYSMLLLACGMKPAVAATGPEPPPAGAFTADGRSTLEQLSNRYQSLSTEHGWTMETVYQYPGIDAPAIRAWRTAHRGEALWILAGIHGEEPAGPNAIAAHLPSIIELAASGVPIVVIPLCNPKAYRSNWRYPNTSERDWQKGGYSVGDAEYLLAEPATGDRPRAAKPPGPDTKALTEFVLRLAESYPPRLVLDLHEDELSTDGGYIYSQGSRAQDNPVGAEVIRLLRQSGIPIRESGRTRFDEPIVDGVISRDDKGQPIRDGSIDELLSANEIFVDGKKVSGPAAGTVIVVETPAFAGSQFDLRMAAQGAVIRHLRELWQLSDLRPGVRQVIDNQ